MAGGGWAGPLDTCGCCGAQYGYIDGGGETATVSYSHTWTKGRCARCGGRSVLREHFKHEEEK